MMIHGHEVQNYTYSKLSCNKMEHIIRHQRIHITTSITYCLSLPLSSGTTPWRWILNKKIKENSSIFELEKLNWRCHFEGWGRIRNSFAMIIRLPKRCRRLKKMDLRWDRSLGTASSPVMEVGWLGHSFTSFLSCMRFFDRREGLLCTLPKHAIILRPNSMKSTHERDSALFLSQTNGWWYFPQKCDRENPSSHTHWF